MFLTIDAFGYEGPEHKIDLTDLVNYNDDVVDEDTLRSVLDAKIASKAIEWNVDIDNFFPLFIYDQEIWEDPSLSECIDVSGEGDWLKEVAQFAWFVEEDSQYIDRDQIFAYMNNCWWRYINFDRLEDEITERFHSEFDGDYEEFAREWMSNFDEGDLPDHLQSHFDYSSYGEELVGSFDELTWNDRTFLYSQ